MIRKCPSLNPHGRPIHCFDHKSTNIRKKDKTHCRFSKHRIALKGEEIFNFSSNRLSIKEFSPSVTVWRPNCRMWTAKSSVYDLTLTKKEKENPGDPDGGNHFFASEKPATIYTSLIYRKNPLRRVTRVN